MIIIKIMKGNIMSEQEKGQDVAENISQPSRYDTLSEKSRTTIKKTAAEWTRQKRSNGEIKNISISGKPDDIQIIRTAITHYGGSNISALVGICREYLLREQSKSENDNSDNN